MIVSFRHKAVEEIFRTGKSRKINSEHWAKIKQMLDFLNIMPSEYVITEMVQWAPHRLHGKNNSGQDINQHWALKVSANYRLTYFFTEDGNVVLVDYIDYH